ncbi:MAG TPA: methylmalonyl-CoA mutase [Thermoplasmata archaeon]|nr:methylmalonyl-CoA mutase [Thermoplasmata archaeon]
MAQRKIRVLMAKPGLDAHWRGLITVSSALRDGGMEIIYGGNMTPAEVAKTALQEDVDVVGMSLLVPRYMRLVSETIQELKKCSKGDALVLLGGIIYDEDIPTLKEMGVAEVFGPGTPLAEIVEFTRRHAPSRPL